MKKIIATVLAMVMALALCTTAFAAGSTTTEVASKGWTMKKMADNSAITIVADKFTKTVTSNDVIKDVTYYYADKYVIDGTVYYVCDDSIAMNKLYKGSEIVYLTTADLSAGVSKVVDKTVDAVKNPGCGQYDKATGYTVLVIDNVAYWAEQSTNYAMLNGKVVSYGAEATAKAHVFDKKNVTTDTADTFLAITCDKCNKTYKLAEDIPSNYTGTVAKDKIYDGTTGYFVLLDDEYVSGNGSTTTTTTSPKTFDAGIAMYVGMALTSVAGSAVVIGKKKEF